MSRGKHKRADGEHFARIPKDVMLSAALASAPHAAFRVLAILLVGKTKESNGTMMCTDSHAAKFGLSSHDTLQRSLATLEQRGLIVVTRKVQRLRRFPALYAVTWWPIHNRHGQPVTPPDPATHEYRKWRFTPTIGVTDVLDCSPRPSGDNTPTIGVEGSIHHPDLPSSLRLDHPDSRGHSKTLPQGPSASAASRVGGFCLDLETRIEKLMTLQPHLPNGDVAKILHTEIERVARVRERMTGNGRQP
jgi:hypothetical protein